MKYARHIVVFLLPIAVSASLFWYFAFRPRQNSAWQLADPKPADFIAGWPEMGMWLPDEPEIQRFASHFESSSELLGQALAHVDVSIRMRAAFVIGQIGPPAKSLGPVVSARLRYEPDRLVRIYMVNALNSIECKDVSAVADLRERYESLSSLNVPHSFGDNSHADVDEKITIAAALYRLVSEEEKPKYLVFVTDWLKAPAAEIGGSELNGYWERRWMAVNVLERMPGALDAVPRLEALQREPNAKSWVNVHVPRVLAALQPKP